VGLWPAFLLIRQADRPLHLKDFCQHIGTKNTSRAAHHVRLAEQAGLMRKIGWLGGWVAMG
jgi:predicted MarR family transcription regulator